MIYGALNNLNDPTHQKRDKHASIYYESIRNSNKEIFIKRISDNTRIDCDLVRKAVNHVFFTKHYLQEDITYKYDYFSPSYDMAESWQRMSEGINIQKHDIILLEHEALESDLWKAHPSWNYDQVHKEAEKVFNYHEALNKWMEERKL